MLECLREDLSCGTISFFGQTLKMFGPKKATPENMDRAGSWLFEPSQRAYQPPQ
jgi:hypothetical protein